jgi:hypothetical protein
VQQATAHAEDVGVDVRVSLYLNQRPQSSSFNAGLDVECCRVRAMVGLVRMISRAGSVICSVVGSTWSTLTV